MTTPTHPLPRSFSPPDSESSGAPSKSSPPDFESTPAGEGPSGGADSGIKEWWLHFSQMVMDLPRRRPMLVSGLGLGALYLIWQGSNRPRQARTLSKYLAGKARNFDKCVSELQHTAVHCGREAAAAVSSVADTVHQTGDSLADGLDQTRRAARDLQKLIHREPGLAIAGSVAMAVGLALLWRSPEK